VRNALFGFVVFRLFNDFFLKIYCHLLCCRRRCRRRRRRRCRSHPSDLGGHVVFPNRKRDLDQTIFAMAVNHTKVVEMAPGDVLAVCAKLKMFACLFVFVFVFFYFFFF
jgi:hypothetical protein